MLGPRTGDVSVSLSPGFLNKEFAGVQESTIEPLQGIGCVFGILKSNEAELASLGACKHDLGISDSILVISLEVLSKFTLFQVLG